MAPKRIVSERIAIQKTYEKLNRDLGVLPKADVDQSRKQQEIVAIKALINKQS